MNKYILGIGASNVDLYCKSNIEIKDHFDHPCKITYTPGGVTRNILENIHKLGFNTKLLSCVGKDIYGDYLLKKIKESGIDCKDIKIVDDQNTGLFVQIQDQNNDMHIAMCDMNILKHIDIEYIKNNDMALKKASAIVLDPSLENEVLAYLFANYKNIPIFVDPISEIYAKKIRPYLSDIYCIKPNCNELSILADMKINNHDDLIEASKIVLNKGVSKLFVSLGSKGCIYNDESNHIVTRAFKEVDNIINASGAGDSFFAAIIYCMVTAKSLDDTINYALAAGIAAITCKETINPDLSIDLLEKIIKEKK